jgi:hypothetical protein
MIVCDVGYPVLVTIRDAIKATGPIDDGYTIAQAAGIWNHIAITSRLMQYLDSVLPEIL